MPCYFTKALREDGSLLDDDPPCQYSWEEARANFESLKQNPAIVTLLFFTEFVADTDRAWISDRWER